MCDESVVLTLYLHSETKYAMRVSDDGEEKRAVWLPKSIAKIKSGKQRFLEIKMSEWLAKDRGLI